VADREHLAFLKRCLTKGDGGADAWNTWIRDDSSDSKLKVDLSGAHLEGVVLLGFDLQDVDFRNANLSGSTLGVGRLSFANFSGADLEGADFEEANLEHANLSRANLRNAELDDADLEGSDLSYADLTGATLKVANLIEANLSHATLCGAHFAGANLTRANLSGANLRDAHLQNTTVLRADLTGADLAGANVYGIAAWDIEGTPKCQEGLIITPANAASVSVDDLEVAHFVYLLLKREKLRAVLETITARAVLILGRFTPDRKAILDALASELRRNSLIPIIFDFERATSRDFTETVKVLAGLSLFVIADITRPSSVPLELQATVPDYQIPFVPIIQQDEAPFSMFIDLKTKYQWVLQPLVYPTADVLVRVFKKAILDEAFEMHKRILALKAEKTQMRSAEDYLAGQETPTS
jgi:hypothetical protein